MRPFSSRTFSSTLIPLLCLLCVPTFSQEPMVAHVCVAVLRSGANTVSSTEARDRLVKALNQQKPDKKLRLSALAVPLESPWGAKAMEEAKEKSCEFVLSTRLTDLSTSSVPATSTTLGTDSVPVFDASVEYQLIRTLDGTVFSIGSVKGEDQSSLREAVWQAIAHIAAKAIPDIAKNGNAPPQSPPEKKPEPVTPKQIEVTTFSSNPCAWLPTNISHADAVAGVCQFAMSLPQKMPNFICDQEASRYRGKNNVPFDLVTASVRYEDGNESYDQIKVNGKLVATALAQTPGLWSTGEFGSNLRSIFDLRNQALFEFAREVKWGDHFAWIFTYTIVKQNDPLWRLHGGDEVLAPPYEGELWVDQKTGELLRFGSVAKGIPSTFPMAGAELQIDYASVAFADGSSFDLPADFTVTTSYRGQEPTRNLVQFRNCHKFRAKSRMVLNVPGGVAAGDSSADASNRAAELERELEENNKIYDILREQAVREDAALLEAVSTAEQQAATVAVFSKLNGLEKQREKNVAQQAALASSAAPAGALTTLKVSVKLVPVSVVLRDAKGNVAGNLRKEDFLLFDNGKPQVITSFSVERPEAADPTENPAETYPPNPSAKFAERRAPTAVRNVAYVFDDIHAAFGDLNQARVAAERHIAALGPGDRVALFSTSGEIGTEFTDNREKLQQVLKGLRQHPILHGALCPPVSEYMADLIVNHDDNEALGAATQDAISCAFGGMGGADSARAEQIARIAAFEVNSAASAANQNTLNVLQEVVRRLSALPGSHSMVLVSPGFLTLTPETRQSAMELVERAVRANIIVNTLDVRGLYITGVTGNTGHPANPVFRLGLDRDEALAQSDVMAELAYGTGGTFFHNNNDVNEGFRRTADAPEFVYVLGFSPQKLDGKFHKLKVKLSRAELTVQARQGYYALTAPSAQ